MVRMKSHLRFGTERTGLLRHLIVDANSINTSSCMSIFSRWPCSTPLKKAVDTRLGTIESEPINQPRLANVERQCYLLILLGVLKVYMRVACSEEADILNRKIRAPEILLANHESNNGGCTSK
jgi:hypothetical protein